MKTCNKCNKPKELNLFTRRKHGILGRRAQCKACYLLIRFKNGKTPRSEALYYKYGMRLSDYDKMLTDQNDACKICKAHKSMFNKPLFVDHCHVTKKVRGLLCNLCNTGISKLKDDANIIKEAVLYLTTDRSNVTFIYKR